MLENVWFYIFIFILGAIMGSFAGALAWRLKNHKDWIRGRSECEHCHHQLAARDLIPIVSYLSLGGKCRYCHKKIGATALRLEIFTGLAFLGSAMLFPMILANNWANPLEDSMLNLSYIDSRRVGACAPFTECLVAPMAPMTRICAIAAFVIWLVALVILVALFTYDRQWKILPDKLIYPLIAVLAVYSLVFWLGVRGESFLVWLETILLGMVPLFGVYLITYVFSRGKWIGFGDVKLCLAMSFALTWWQALLVLFSSNLIGAVISVPRVVRGKARMNSQIAFGPCLIAAFYLVFLVGWAAEELFVLV